jgi:iron(III) transport system permease protein
VLYYGGMSTMPIEIFQQVDSGRLGLASAYSVLLMLAIFVPLAIARWVFRVKGGCRSNDSQSSAGECRT